MISWPFYTYMEDKKFNYMIKKTKDTLDFIRKNMLDKRLKKICLICCRGGSKTIKNKNIKKF